MAGRKFPNKDYDGTKPLPDPRQEMFCIVYTTNTLPNFWANGQNSYEFAYGFTQKIEDIQKNTAELRELMKLDKKKRKKPLAQIDREISANHKEIERLHNVASASASRSLLSESIKKRCGALLDALALHTIVDRELVYLIQQRNDNHVKIEAIKHHDKREKRILDKVEMQHTFEPISGFDYVKPKAK